MQRQNSYPARRTLSVAQQCLPSSLRVSRRRSCFSSPRFHLCATAQTRLLKPGLHCKHQRKQKQESGPAHCARHSCLLLYYRLQMSKTLMKSDRRSAQRYSRLAPASAGKKQLDLSLACTPVPLLTGKHLIKRRVRRLSAAASLAISRTRSYRANRHSSTSSTSPRPCPLPIPLRHALPSGKLVVASRLIAANKARMSFCHGGGRTS